MITPAISVLSAVEGLEMVTPIFAPYVVPITIAILIALFAVQRHGTARIGAIFGPVMLIWFATLGVLGAIQVVQHPGVLAAVEPVPRCALLRAQRIARLPRPRLGVPRRDRRRSALRGHGPLRCAADPAVVVLLRPPCPAAELLRSGRARAAGSGGGGAPVLPARTVLGGRSASTISTRRSTTCARTKAYGARRAGISQNGITRTITKIRVSSSK